MVPEKHRLIVAELMQLINWGQKYGHFELDMGEARFGTEPRSLCQRVVCRLNASNIFLVRLFSHLTVTSRP